MGKDEEGIGKMKRMKRGREVPCTKRGGVKRRELEVTRGEPEKRDEALA